MTRGKSYRRAEKKIAEILRTGATELHLGHMKLTEIPESLGQLTQLRSLHIFDNKLSALPTSLARLERLQELDLPFNRLTSLPEFLGNFTQLQKLNLSSNQLTALPESLGQLKTLRQLQLNNNRLRALPDSVGQLTQLQQLNLNSNHLSTLPDVLSRLTQLLQLYVHGNQLRSLPDSLGQLKQLQELHLNENSLAALPTSLLNLSNLRELFLHQNDALGIPVEILGPTSNAVRSKAKPPADPATILDYYFRSRRGRRPLNEAKLILLGRGGVGKTCLIKRLIHDTFDEKEPETPGIEIQPWEVALDDGDKVRLHVWDFGGQEILHATHQFFLTERTLYLLVISGREGTATQDAEYWLQLIRSFGGNSPVIVALNKSEQHPFDVNRGLLLEKYPQIADFVRTDCAYATGIEDLRQLILSRTAALEYRKVDFPADWFEIKERLAGMEENFVTWDQYQEICREKGEQDGKAQRDLAGFLHILGIALNYRDDPRLKDTHVLNPRWVTEGIYSLLRAGQKQKHQREGVLEIDNLAKVLDKQDYPETSHEFLMTLMEKFQLCFRLPGRRRQYLVPEMLGENQPDEVASLLAEPGLGFRYQYEVLPEGLLPHFIVQTHAHSEANPQWRWRTGVVLERDGCRAVVRADARERRVDIHVIGPERGRRDLLAIIRERFDEQHRDLKGLTVDERVPVPAEPGVTVSYGFLLELEEEGELWCRPEGSRRKISVAALLNGVESSQCRDDRRERGGVEPGARVTSKRHVFLSYCHDNKAEVRRLHDDLLAAGETVWWDKEILGGEDWQQAIRRAMKESYAVVLCLSPELAQRVQSGVYPEVLDAIRTYRRQTPGTVFLIPVKLAACEIPDIEIDDTRTLDRLQAIELFPKENWRAGLERLLDSLRAAPNHS